MVPSTSPCTASIHPRIRLTLFTLAAILLPGAIVATGAEPTPLYRWTTLAGRATTGFEDGPAADARFSSPHGVALDASGNLYVADTANHTIRKISPQGVVSTLAGSPDQPGSADGTGSAARFLLPKGVAVDALGNVYVADSGNHTLRKITPAGVVTTLAGAAGQQGNADGVGTFARFSYPTSLFVDANGNVYVPQQGLRRISPNGTVDTLPLTGPLTPPSGNPIAELAPGTMAVDPLGQVYFFARARKPDGSLDFHHRLIKRDVTGALSVLASSDNADGKPFLSPLVQEVLPTTAPDGSVYFVTQFISSTIEYRLHRLAPDGNLSSTLWRGANRGGFGDAPQGLAVASDGRIFHTAPAVDDVVFVFQGETSHIYAGTPWSNRGIDGPGAQARFSRIGALAASPAGHLLVGDDYSFYAFDFYGGASVRTVSATGETATLYTGPSSDVPRETTLGIAPLAGGNVALLTYYGPPRLLQISPAGVSSPISRGDLQNIRGLGSDASGALIAFEWSSVHRRDPNGAWSLLAGSPGQPADIVDGNAGQARFANLISLAVTPGGDAYVLDHLTTPTARSAVRRIQPDGTVTTVVNNLIRPDGASPARVAVDAKGDFIVTYSDDTVRLVTAAGTEFVIGGAPGQSGIRDGDGQTARFYQPDVIATDAQNNVFVADNASVSIRKGEFLGYSAAITQHPQSLTVAAGSSAQFTVTASGTPAPTYQWQFNGTALAGATGSTLTLAGVTAANAGSYTVVVTNPHGSVTSNAATLTVTGGNPNPPPASGGGGGGSPSLGFVTALLALGIGRIRRQATTRLA